MRPGHSTRFRAQSLAPSLSQLETRIDPQGTKSNRDRIGARVKVVSTSGLTQYFTINTAIGYQSASDKRLIVGLGDDSVAKLIEIRWPSGTIQKFENVKTHQLVKAVESPR
jgi:enediyne biosynthesis protein E4